MTTLKKRNIKNKYKNKNLKKFNHNEWTFQGCWKQNLFSASFWESRYDTIKLNELNLSITEPGSFILSGGNSFSKNSIISEFSNQIINQINKKNKNFFLNIKNNTDNTIKKALAFSEKNKNSDANLKIFKKMISLSNDMHFYWYLAAIPFNITLEKQLIIELNKLNINKSEIPNIIPKFQTLLLNQQKELIKFKKNIGNKKLQSLQNDKKLLGKLKDHIKKYEWIKIANWVGKKLTLPKLYDQIINQNEIKHAKNKKYKLSVKANFISECFSYIGYSKQISAEMVSIYATTMRLFLKKIAKKLDITYEQMMYLSTEEISCKLNGDKINLKSLIKKRKKFNWMIMAKKQRKTILITDTHDIKLLKNNLLQKIDTESNKIQGDTANKGLVKGTAKIILNSKDFPKFKKGDILVTTMTTPDFVILMQKASAIITDIGGLLCHAAIFSRELNIPCIIGTLTATKILKDGDLIEVNATNGIINILNC